MKKFTLAFLFLISSNAHAVGLGLGTYMPASNRYQNQPDGSRDGFQLNPYVSLSTKWNFFNNHYIAPEIGMAFHTKTEDEYSKRTVVILWHMAYRLSESFYLRYGFGTFWTRISGDGEEVVLPNGSSTATFYAPSESATTYNTSTDIGLEYQIGGNEFSSTSYSLRGDLMLVQPLDSDERSFSYLLSLVYSI